MTLATILPLLAVRVFRQISAYLQLWQCHACCLCLRCQRDEQLCTTLCIAARQHHCIAVE